MSRQRSVAVVFLGGMTLAGCAMFGVSRGETGTDDFDAAVRPILVGTCAQCHDGAEPAGGMSVAPLTSAESVIEPQHRETWEAILGRLRAGTMPPPSVSAPEPERLAEMVRYVEGAFARADAARPVDPGRVVAHRLNRNEYMNTVRDLLGVRYRADREFPADDSGEGFDNMAELLTLSPLLMERYMAAAERISGWVIPTELPDQILEIEYRRRDGRIRRLGPTAIEADHRVDFPGEYVVRIELPGERPPQEGRDAQPVMLGLWMDGELVASKMIETKPSGLVYFSPYSEEEMRLHLSAGDHTFRAAFIDDTYPEGLTGRDAFDRDKNKFLDGIVFTGPYPSDVENASRARILVCDPTTGQACVERILTELAQRAYRRPPTDHDVEALVRFVDLTTSGGGSVEDGIRLALQAVLVSPHFLFRIERDPDPLDPTVHEVSPFELASRLSYFLWSSMPDDELFELAEAGRLHDPEVLPAQVDRMLADPRAEAFAENFAGQWLETRNLDVVRPDPDVFAAWDVELRDAMKQETTLFFQHVLRENRPVSDFLDADYTYLNERLAEHYGIEGVSGPDFRYVELATDRRGGVLGLGAVLTVSSYPTRTSPVIRGKYVLQNLLGTPPPPPPPDVPSLEESAGGGSRSMREQLELHRSNPTCAACHRPMDPLGFGLENYDGIGRWRDTDGDFAIDASGSLPTGATFTSAAEMRALLVSELPQFSRTLTEKMLTYALRRSLQPYDRVTVGRIDEAVTDDDYRFRTMVYEIVKSLPFQARRGEDLTVASH
jgi:mono/diheme cytochrome c family protein